MLEVKDIVEQGYDRIANDYYMHRDLKKFNTELESFSKLLVPKGKVLDVGTGAGIPTAKYLVNRGFDVTGIDLSERMINLAKENVPNARFLKMDINNITFPNNSFDGLVSVYTLFHIPRDSHQEIFKKFYDLLKPQGIMMINNGVSESEGYSTFFGVRMFWSNYRPKKTLEFVKNAGFSILFEGILVRGGEHQYWIFAKKTKK